ncbi:MarR family transcriptional regulator [Salinibacterium sp. NSLL150]|uniref:MarR family winged helix-turn-helix transcriptional regulator n=1 Tax=unclassified Salinibacterium TaxID=2632331 RepID=UPI0018CE4B56|nr:MULTISPECIES: MarR family transcriptional regulator [unclassified Salinibacterium]MBH0099480.1 MarR family transcriptional regulator [Salinibacterium sp. NSLL35]MBH0102234.1 MarR family transcriptional regulator [Salinibacterium sp. NSLL150]MBH0104994.1 MarR family transcriptional regulator [Salinibacterium sp. NSLL16]MBH0107754.1 MarR family transcriptional regulator [Salinibacterium sp. NSLL17]
MAGPHTLTETERQVQAKVGGLPLDYSAMAVASNLFRAANAVRNHFERTVLSEHNLSWTAFVVLWVTWIWEPIETRQIALEGGFSKATLTGVLTTLERRGWLIRQRSASDGRLVVVNLTDRGRELMVELFPAFNLQEQAVTGPVDPSKREELAEMLRVITAGVEPKN